MRCGVLPIRIETWRFKGEDVGERICIYCNMGEVEDELHFVIHCPKYQHLRENVIRYVEQYNTNFLTMNVNEQFNLIIKDYPRQVAKYVKNVMNIKRLISHI